MEKGSPTSNASSPRKFFASFGGDMRDDLVAMLDLLGVHKLIGESTTRNLWTLQGYAKAHFCSLLSFPTLKDGGLQQLTKPEHLQRIPLHARGNRDVIERFASERPVAAARHSGHEDLAAAPK